MERVYVVFWVENSVIGWILQFHERTKETQFRKTYSKNTLGYFAPIYLIAVGKFQKFRVSLVRGR